MLGCAGDINITPRNPLANDCHSDELKLNWTTLPVQKGIAMLCYWTFCLGISAISGLLRLHWTIKLLTCLETILVLHSWRLWRWIVGFCLCFTLVFTVKTSLNSFVPSILFLTYTRRQIRWHGSNMLLNTYLCLCCPLVFAVGKLYKLSTNYSISCWWLKRNVYIFGPSVEQLKVWLHIVVLFFCNSGWRGLGISNDFTGSQHSVAVSYSEPNESISRNDILFLRFIFILFFSLLLGDAKFRDCIKVTLIIMYSLLINCKQIKIKHQHQYWHIYD